MCGAIGQSRGGPGGILETGGRCYPVGARAMRIKKIEISGFKSFADREVVHIDDHVTAVIGPNGCGKSNIVDAMRWCLGEQRAKHLRGTGMADVIFAGCSTRGPGNAAEVTLTFENSGNVPVAYLNYAEIAVTRRLLRDGTSEYLINKVNCRLRDVQELMTGTGAGGGSTGEKAACEGEAGGAGRSVGGSVDALEAACAAAASTSGRRFNTRLVPMRSDGALTSCRTSTHRMISPAVRRKSRCGPCESVTESICSPCVSSASLSRAMRGAASSSA